MNIKEELRITGLQSVVGWSGSDIEEIFSIWINKYGHQNIHTICSLAYNLGMIHGKREERARRRKNHMGRLKESLLILLSMSTEAELYEMLDSNEVNEIVKTCAKEEIEYRKERGRKR